MRITTLRWGAALGLALAACGSDDGGPSFDTDAVATDGAGVDDGSDGSDSSGDGGDSDSDDSDTGNDSDTSDTGEEPAGPHALGSIVLGESHSPQGGAATPFVSASFIPDADAAGSTCAQEVAGCEVLAVPDCGPCGSGEFCAFDDGCQATCQPFCDAACGSGEVCYFPSPGQTGCRAIETFDAGALNFTGTTTPITLFPPYSYTGETGGAPFAPGAEITITASGATAAGFEAFERTFSGTDFVQTNLDQLRVQDMLGDGDATLTWQPSNDDMTVTASIVSQEGTTGTIVCEVDDASGSFSLPTAAIDAAIGGGSVGSISVSVTRSRTELYRDGSTKGTLLEATVQPEGWVSLSTQSTESTTLQLLSCYDCQIDANSNACSSQVAACENSVECNDYFNCLNNGTPQPQCATEFPNGATLLDALFSCQCDTCSYECADDPDAAAACGF